MPVISGLAALAELYKELVKVEEGLLKYQLNTWGAHTHTHAHGG